ncbi:hypothetical protein KQI74_00975 [Paenibacillus barcinonensis]|jgi:cell division protein FtsL|uniref:hypothetical protein n=1 Tax=Paenibacillus barcinonensis TaxID=198119 RepID=UPI001C108FD3|nr:hypothetical protein [Paenibacillus barcinonensis]MBU5350829.1 hypothetical protein [Paenibacillus barcinonensis]
MSFVFWPQMIVILLIVVLLIIGVIYVIHKCRQLFRRVSNLEKADHEKNVYEQAKQSDKL